MRLIVFSDLHDNAQFLNHLEKIREEADLVVFLGDVSDSNNLELGKKVYSLIDYYIPGNIDTPEMVELFGPKNIHGKRLRYGEFHISAIGYSNPTPFNTPGELSEEEIRSLGRQVIEKGDILFTHAPPYNILDMISSGAHVGSRGLREIIDERPPLVHVFGHIHEEVGVEKRKGSVYVNLLPAYQGGYAKITLSKPIPEVEFLRMP